MTKARQVADQVASRVEVIDDGVVVASVSTEGIIDAVAYTQVGQPLEAGGGDVSPLLLMGA